MVCNGMRKSKIFYGWFVVVAGFFVTFTLGEAMWSFGVFFKPLAAEFGWSRALVSSAYTAFMIGFSVSVIFTGRLVDKYSPRPILMASAILAGVGISLCGRVDDINQLRACLFFAGLGGGATWSVPTATVQRWFNHRKKAGLALGIVISGIGLGAMVFTPLINYLIIIYGWRNTYSIVGALYFAIIIASALVMKKSPVDSGQEREGSPDVPASLGDEGLTTKKALFTHAFASIMIINCIVVVACQTVTVHMIPHATDKGISPTIAAAALGLAGGFSFLGRILSGIISDRMNWQMTLAFACLGMALFLSCLLFLYETWILYCFVIFYGVFQGMRSPAHVGVLGEFFGMRSLGELIGITAAIAMMLGAFAPYVAGFIFDATGSYFWAFVLVMALLFAGSIIAGKMKRPLP